jgi:NADH-quinone oxidoreductase subunit J
MNYFFSILSALLLGGCILVIGVQNPVHSILILILVFLFSSILLFILQLEYFALLFMLVYIGAIVVLFLFIVMMLEIKMVNSSERFKDFFSIRNLILGILLLQVLFFVSDDVIDLFYILNVLQNKSIASVLTEINLFTNYS